MELLSVIAQHRYRLASPTRSLSHTARQRALSDDRSVELRVPQRKLAALLMECEVDGLHVPLLMHLAEEDEFISKSKQAEIKAALAGKPNATVGGYSALKPAGTARLRHPDIVTSRVPFIHS
jgi:hypothetical protein